MSLTVCRVGVQKGVLYSVYQ